MTAWPRLARAFAVMVLALLLLALPPLVPPLGHQALPADAPVTFDLANATWTVAADGSAVVEAEVTLRLPKTGAMRVARVPLMWSGSTETMEVLEARVEKPNGRLVPIGKDAIREDPPEGDRYFHEFSDVRRVIITFQDAGAGDLLLIRTRRVLFRPRVPGGFMTAPVLAGPVGWEETNYTISVPSVPPLHVETRGFDHQKEVILDRTLHYFRSRKASEASREISLVGAFDRLPRFAVSTFRDWDAFATAYGAMLLSHARVTPAIRDKAVRLTAGQEEAREQARLLYDWVRDHVGRVPVPLDESPPEPHDAETVLANLYGDGKDTIVLLHALLAARGIAAEPVLLNSSDTATIAGPPNLRPMNHLILFLPMLNVYLDPMIGTSPFGTLPFQELGKPAIHLGGAGPARRTIPVPPASETVSEMTTIATLDAEGALTGTTETTARGAFGSWLRSVAHSMGENGRGATAITLLRQRGTPGTGDFTFPSPSSPGPDYTVRGTFRINNQMQLLNGGYFALWTGLRILPRPGDFLTGPLIMKGLAASEPTFCYPGTQRETLILILPEGREMSAVPKDLVIDTPLARFRSHWEVEGRRVTVTRAFASGVAGPVCEGTVREQLNAVMPKVRDDLLNQVGIRLNLAAPPAGAMEEVAKP